MGKINGSLTKLQTLGEIRVNLSAAKPRRCSEQRGDGTDRASQAIDRDGTTISWSSGARRPCEALRSAIVGTWVLTSVADRYDSGQSVNHWGTVKGTLMFDAGGRFSQIIIGEAQPALKSPGRY